ncbi:MAG: YjgP/YjgQ family permease [Ancylobacter novellus]|uniref:YjgP/YjgQ family permease n=1 Tax=Ancylobacter novellus TaxID=921 RepID=A0A2W5MNC8_ANCNO|nr:MAG: YjgP/YjgQ family permease [Ancylobacter novellus]
MSIAPRMRILDRYVLMLTLKPMAICLAVVLSALLLERILRLIDILATAGAPVFIAFALAANLVPHYLGFAMPAGFALGVYSAVSKLSLGAELEAALASGVSVRTLVRPLVLLGCLLSVVSLVVVGYAAPYCRYSYREIINQSVSYAWRAHAPAATFISVKDGLTITADEVDKTGRKLRGVFIQNRENNVDVVTSSESGELELTPDKLQIQLRLKNGSIIRDYGAERPSTLRFQDFVLDKKFDLTAPPFRPRGGSERELTLTELWSEMNNPLPTTPYSRLSAEFHSRLARSLSLIFLPLLIVPLSMTMRRNARIVNMATAAVATVLYHNSLQIGETLGDKGVAPAWLTCWTPFVLFLALSVWMFATSTDRPGDTAISRMSDRIGNALSGLFRGLRGRLRPARG